MEVVAEEEKEEEEEEVMTLTAAPPTHMTIPEAQMLPHQGGEQTRRKMKPISRWM